MTADEVAAGIKKKEIVIIDEIISPMSRWRLVRDEPQFEAVVEEIRRGQMNSREDTEVQGHTDTNTGSVTGVVMALAPSQGAPPSPPPIDASKAVDAEFTETVVKPKVRSASLQADVRQYGVQSQTGYPQRTGLVKIAWLGAVAAVGGALYFYQNSSSQRPVEPPSAPAGFERLVRDASQAWERGDFASSLKFYRRANQSRAGQVDVVARLAPLMIQLEGETVAAKRLLTETLAASGDVGSSLKSQLETGLGLAALASEDFAEADAHFRVALNLVPGSFAPMLNSGTVSYLAKAVPEAVRRYSFAGEHPTALVLGALAILRSESGENARKAAQALLSRSLQKFHDFRQEAYLISAWVKLDGGDDKAALADARSALDVDPDMTAEHWHDPFLYLEPLRWKWLAPMCRRLAEELKFSTTRALLGLCVFKAGDRDEASNILSQAMSQDPESALLQSVRAYALFTAGRFEDARSALRIATRLEVPRLAQIVQARICSRAGDIACSERAWRGLLAQENPPLAAMTGVAEALLMNERAPERPPQQKRADREAAADLVRRARGLSPLYRPAILLNESLR